MTRCVLVSRDDDYAVVLTGISLYNSEQSSERNLNYCFITVTVTFYSSNVFQPAAKQ